MSVATYAEARLALQDAVDELAHPFKGNYVKKGKDTGIPHRFGKILYREGGQVGVSYRGRFYVGRGEDHEDSVYALAYNLGLQVKARKDGVEPRIPDPGVAVDEVDAGWFWLFCNPEGKLPAEG